jgi:hypothetical protein
MKTTIFAGLLGALILSAGCVKTVNDRTTPAVPFVGDKVESRYQRPVLEVFGAARSVVTQMGGTISSETTLYAETNAVKTLAASLDKRKLWVRVEPVDAAVTQVTIQARTSGGGSDMNLVREVDKRIALQLATGR